MSVVASRPISPSEEILVSYNYTVILAPEWYKQLWLDHLRKAKGYSEDKVQEWVDVQVATWGYKM